VFYDTQDRRARLSNGLHTLLHLVRASLHEDQKGDFSDECLLNQFAFEEDNDDVASPKAAIKFLKSRKNLEQPIFPTLDEIRTEQATVHSPGGQTTITHYRETTTVRLKDRVCQIMDVLWQLLDHQATLDIFTAGLPVRLPRGKLEGYRFMEVATRRSITPRVVHLRAFEGAGKSWVDFMRAIRAVTLFGEGFGELIAPWTDKVNQIAPSNSGAVCNRWKTLPKNRDCLAASCYDLSRILRQEGSATSNPVMLAPGILWNQSTTAFERCACASPRNNKNLNMLKGDGALLRASDLLRRPCDKVQVLLPSSSRLTGSILPRSGSLSTSSSSSWILGTDTTGNRAVIFGRSELFPWRWPDLGDPEMEGPSKVHFGTGGTSGSDPSLLSAKSASASTSTRSPSMSGESREETTVTGMTEVSTPPSSMPRGEGEMPGILSVEDSGGNDSGGDDSEAWRVLGRNGRGIGIRRLWKWKGITRKGKRGGESARGKVIVTCDSA